MSLFFDKPFFQQLVAGFILLLLSLWLGARTNGPTTGGNRVWKIIIIFSWTMVLGGLYLFFLNVHNGVLKNERAVVSLGISLLGFALNKLGKFFLWWHS